ncbi:hypothetical protein RhiirB3_394879 [Rhizophagus irregularis]|nr:hypothetical protein RhiirB3_394879 [Rhizophagus irregularis]
MEIVNTNDKNSFDPTPRLKSSPIPIEFISFSVLDENCVYCGEKYINALFTSQKYCKKCLSRYISDITDNNIYLDVYIYTIDLECSEHEISGAKVPQNIQECCGNCVIILCFKQINGFSISDFSLDKNDLTLLCNKLSEFENIVKNINKYFVPKNILESIFKEKKRAKPINWIPYSQLKDLKEITKGGYGIIYEATWSNNNNKNEIVILKRFENSKSISKYFLNELKSCYHCFKDKKRCHVIETYGFTKDPKLDDYILIMKYASGGDLHKHLQKDFKSITWNKEKLRILHQISIGSQNLSSTIQNFSTSLKKRRNVEFLNVETHDNNGKRIKTNYNYQ